MNPEKYYYVSLQYSAIQKTVLRHGRLWSIAGISQILSELNELRLPDIVRKCDRNAAVLVAGGGKFTARFDDKPTAETARNELMKAVATAMPMLEFQVSQVVQADTLEQAKQFKKPDKEGEKKSYYPGLIDELNEQKRHFRGYGVTFNPHFQVCDECGEYPADKVCIKDLYQENGKKKSLCLCSTCSAAWDKARAKASKTGKQGKGSSTIQRIYETYLELTAQSECLIPRDFQDMFANQEGDVEGKRMAVWFSDLNNMNSKVPIWLSQSEEEVREIFETVKSANVQILAETLRQVFPSQKMVKRKERTERGKTELIYLPFRLVVAGGDDLCVVMPEEYILNFALTLSQTTCKRIIHLVKEYEQSNPGKRHPLKPEWLLEQWEAYRKRGGTDSKEPGSYSFGGAFIVTPLHTPFIKIHELGESLMKKAKEQTGRKDNSVNWRIMAVEEAPDLSDHPKFDKPLFIDKIPPDDREKHPLSLRGYLAMRDFYSSGRQAISGSQLQQIMGKIIEYDSDSDRIEEWMKTRVFGGREQCYGAILVDSRFRTPDKRFDCSRLATLLELITIGGEGLYE
ncbi:MAG: hypothetical protein A4E57_00771 [Syntrophorhabdaceae bacterium PtaU1.Bin034]|nr:MAG: hypothetical protein A4E57_00771 [Syntrophorhabdaceae bacterium PtaU1.Bin034]